MSVLECYTGHDLWADMMFVEPNSGSSGLTAMIIAPKSSRDFDMDVRECLKKTTRLVE